MVCVKIIFPKYKICPDCKLKGNSPSSPAEPPLDRFKECLPFEMFITSFEGVSINFKKKKVTRFFRLYEYIKNNEAGKKKVFADISKWLDHNPDPRLIINKEIAFNTKCNLSFVFVPANYPYEETNVFSELSSCPIIVATYHLDGRLEILAYSIESFCKSVRELRGGKFFEHRKKLKVARTYFECYLSNKTKDPWPGDIDALICKRVDGKYRPFMLVEFKTHNLNTPIEEEETFKYFKEDKRRLNALSIIQNALKVNFIYIIWNRNDSKIKIEINPFSTSKKEKINKVCEWKDLKKHFLEISK